MKISDWTPEGKAGVPMMRRHLRLMRGEKFAVAIGALLGLLCITFFDVVFLGRTLLTSPYTASVMGVQPPYGYPGEPLGLNQYIIDAGASAWQYEPLTAKVSRLYRSGRLPLWNSSQGFGAPLAANMQSSVFYLPALPLMLRPTPAVWDAYLLARLLFAGIFTFLFAGLIGIGQVGAVGAGAAFMVSGYFLFWINNSWLNVDILTPALLYGIERVIQRPAGRWALFLASVVAATILGGMPESTFVVLLCGAGYAAFRLGALTLAREDWRDVLRRVGTALAAAGLGVGSSAFLLLPFAEYVEHAWHQHLPAAATGLGYFPWRALVTVVLPYVDGPPWASSPATLYYSGAVVTTLAVLGAVAPREGDRSTIRWYFVAATALSLAKTYGVGNWIGTWPLFNLVNFGKHLGVVICFSMAVLAGFGLDAIRRARVSLWVALLAPVGVQVAVLGLLWIHAAGVGAKMTGSYVFGGMGIAAGLVVALQVGLLARVGTGRYSRVIAVCCAGLMFGELLYLAPKFARPLRHPPDTPPPAVTFVQADTTPFRVFGVDGVLYPNLSSYFGLMDIRALDALYPSRYITYIREFVNPSVYDRFTGGLSSGAMTETATRCLRNRWFDLLGVKYVFTHALSSPYGCDDVGSLIHNILARSGISPGLRPDTFVIDGVAKPVLFQHPPNDVRFSLRPDDRSRFLFFSAALDPKVWLPEKGDGVSFEVFIESKGRRSLEFSRWVDPKNNIEDRRWIGGSVDLTPYLHQDIELVLSTKPGATNMWDWAGWGDLILGKTRKELTSTPQYVLAWAGMDLHVYKNTHMFPRAFVVYSVEPVPDGGAALRRMKRAGFDPTKTVVLEGLGAEEAAAFGGSQGAAMMPAEVVAYEDSRVTLRTASPAPGVLVLTDIFYPGWSAVVDGRPTRIYPANFAFRGVLVPAGLQTVEFVYRPRSFRVGAAVSAGSFLVLVFFGFALARWPWHRGSGAQRAEGTGRDG